MPEFYDMDGQPVTMWEWVALMENDIMRRVAATHVGSWDVSTVFLGLNHNFGRQGPPLIYETMIFDEHGIAVECWRYPSRVAALAGHDQAVAMLREKVTS